MKSLENINKARNYAYKTGEINNNEPSKDYIKWLNDTFGKNKDNSKGGIMYDNYDCTGFLTLMYPVPVPKLAAAYNDKMSSFIQSGNSYYLFEDSYWRGVREYYLCISPIAIKQGIGWLNNKVTSYWAF